MHVEGIDFRAISDADVSAFHDLTVAIQTDSRPEDPLPTIEMTKGLLSGIPDSIGVVAGIVRNGAALDGVAYGLLFRTGDNEHMAQVDVLVRPEARRRGIGRALLAHLVPEIEADGRRLLMASTSERVPAGAAFAQAMGAEAGQDAHTNRLVLGDVDRAMVDRWTEQGPDRARGYSLVAIDGRYPDDLIDDIAAVHDVMNDAPRGDLEIEDRRMTPAFLRDLEKMSEAQGLDRWSLFVRHDASGRLVGYTEVAWTAQQPQTVNQMDTAVHPDHRGHALGKWLKAAMLQRVLDERVSQGAVDVRTGNADSNEAMLGINHALGFRPFIASTTWQVSVERAKSALGLG